MTRRPGLALMSATALAASAFTLALAPAASAHGSAAERAADTPVLGDLTVSPSTGLQAGDSISVSGDGCLSVAVLPSSGGSGSPSAGTDPAAATTAAAAVPALADDDEAGSVDVLVLGPDSFSSGTSATASADGSWSGEDGIVLDVAGDYTVRATCTLAVLGGQPIGYQYDEVTLTVDEKPVPLDPSITCAACGGVNPGGTVTVNALGFTPATPATVALAGYPSQTVTTDAAGGLPSVEFVLDADQATGDLAGSVTDGTVTAAFTVTVVAPAGDGGGDVDGDGDVPGGDTDGTDTDGTDTDGTDTDVPGTDTDVDYSSTSYTPGLATTGSDTLWIGVTGGALLAVGGGLMWFGRRRTAGTTA